MDVLIFKNAQEATEKVFELLKSRIQAGIQTLGLATGSTPLKLYKKLRNSKLDVSHITTINLDEYVGLKPTDPQSYNYYMEQELFKHLNFKATYLPNGLAEDLELECKRYEEILEKHPIDLQILGVGPNGHIGFNEPGTPFTSKTHVAKLTPSTREANKRFFKEGEEVPTHALSMGISSILAAKEIVMIAFGETKAKVVKQMIEGPITEDCPASVLQRHPKTTIILDEIAAQKLQRNTHLKCGS